MKIYSWNVNGVRSVENKGALAKFIEQEQPDIICMQETKAHEIDLDLAYPEYEKFWSSAAKKGYSGTSIWTKITPKNVSYGLPEGLIDEYTLDADAYGDPSSEGRVITAEFDDFLLVTVYTPNSKGDLSRLALRYKQWDPAFLKYVGERSKTKPVIFCGDLNVAHQPIDLANPKPNEGKHGYTREEREGFDRILKAGFIDTFRSLHPEQNDAYTWWTHWANARARNVGWRIDYFLMDKALQPRLLSADIHPGVMGSDHCPVSITLKTTS
ncbi:MAG TPA: exodeoxyribonuclease III [Candidatus Saccharimonadaceae bacterium]|nr:exodeoxyribonuclease III [Candidatus Saccharimonadaceae bacterium]